MLTDRAPHTTPPTAATSAAPFEQEQRLALREAADLSADRARVVAQGAVLEGQLQDLAQRGRERLGPAENVLRSQLGALGSAGAGAGAVPSLAEVEALAVATVDYLSLFQEVVLAVLVVTKVQLTACGELLAITDREVEARARALVAAQNAAYVRATDGLAVI